MNLQSAQLQLLGAHQYFETQSAGYQTWGKVNFLRIALRAGKDQILISHPDKPLSEQTLADFQLLPLRGETFYQKIFFWRSGINAVLLTYQEYASQVKETIPPILDDQAQLLGVNVRIARKEIDILCTLFGRYATILGNGQSICIGNSLEDAFVAAQLLEKTSKAFIEAKVLGGAKSINIIEAWAMQQFYLLKYSKEASKNK